MSSLLHTSLISCRLGSSNLANGLDIGGALGGICAGGVGARMSVGALSVGSQHSLTCRPKQILSGLVALLCGWPGLKYHLGFSMMSRATFGMYGAWFVITVKCFVNFILCVDQSAELTSSIDRCWTASESSRTGADWRPASCCPPYSPRSRIWPTPYRNRRPSPRSNSSASSYTYAYSRRSCSSTRPDCSRFSRCLW